MEGIKTNRQLEAEVEALRIRLEEAEETLRAIKNNEVDALVIDGPGGQQIFTLQGAEQPYRILMETMSEGALSMTTDGTILYCNSHLSELIGSPLNKIIGASFHDFVVSRDGQSLEAMLLRCGREGCRGEFLLKTIDGEEVPVSLSARSLIGSDVEGFCIVGADLTDQKRTQAELQKARDHFEERVAERTSELYLANAKLCSEITERKRAEEALRKARDELEIRVEERTTELQNAYDRLREETKERDQIEAQLRQAQKMEALGTLSGGIAHDFNNILAAIIGFTELLESQISEGSRGARHLDRIMQAGLRGRELVRQMLTFSRKTEQEKKPLPVSSMVKETVKLLRAITPSTINIRVNGLAKAIVFADPTQIQQVLMNLCTNALYAMQEKGGTLDIKVSELSVSPSNGDPHPIDPGRYVKISVCDTGIGISSDIIDKIFDPFFTTKKPGEGTGLGLSVVHGIVKQHGGYITAESEPGVGSTFTVYLPNTTGEQETDVASDDTLPTGTEHILFVDDEEALMEMGEEILAELGYEVTSRINGSEALVLFKLDPLRFDLVITDQTMPEMTGVELAKEILKLRADMPIIMCTGFSHRVNADKATAAGIKAFAMKPLTKREIARTIRQVLDE